MSDRRRLIASCLALSLSLVCAWPASTKDAERYRAVPASADGIGKAYLGRQIAHVMGFQGVAWLERDGRERDERSDLLLKILPWVAGSSVADVGAGTGYYARRFADLVGPAGTVYAVDVQSEMVAILHRGSTS